MRPLLAALVAAAVALGVFVVVTGTTLPAARTAAAPALGPATPPAAAPDTAVFAPVDRPGPPLSVPAGMLAASLRCTDDLARSRLDPVLLLSGTAADPDENLGWNIGPALRWAGFPVCTSTAPDRNLGDIQVRGEYVVHAIRAVAERSGRKVALVGHSQGGMVGRWALRFWPDTRGLVSDLVGLAPTNDGAASLSDMCTQPCAAAFWQQRQGSDFVAALNSDRRTFPGISYTVVSSTTDLVATPQPAASALPAAEPGGAGPGSVANIAVQDVCPGAPPTTSRWAHPTR